MNQVKCKQDIFALSYDIMHTKFLILFLFRLYILEINVNETHFLCIRSHGILDKFSCVDATADYFILVIISSLKTK